MLRVSEMIYACNRLRYSSVSFAALAQPMPLHKLDAAQLDHQIARDLRVERYRAGLKWATVA